MPLNIAIMDFVCINVHHRDFSVSVAPAYNYHSNRFTMSKVVNLKNKNDTQNKYSTWYCLVEAEKIKIAE